jgi:murein DD-endopeptidase MepM/ murein hydrolase activator NlpD
MTLVAQAVTAANTTNNHSLYALEDEAGGRVEPSSVIRVGDDLYFLGPGALWICAGAKQVVGGPDILVLRRVGPPASPLNGIPCQEFNDFAYLKERNSLVVLDKSGDLFEFLPASKAWKLLRGNGPSIGAPDPDYISLCACRGDVLLLDPERNQIWQVAANGFATRWFPEVMPWRVKAGDPYVADGLAIGYADTLYLLGKRRNIERINTLGNGRYHFAPFSYEKPNNFRPSRFLLADDGLKRNIYIVEWENNRVLKIDRSNGQSRAYIFPQTSNLRGLVLAPKGFWILSGSYLLYRADESATSFTSPCNPRKLESEFHSFLFPVRGQALPNHPGVFPGARRLYRYGVHEGMDIFGPSMGTPVRAVKDGRVIRTDWNFVDMSAAKLNQVMEECRRQHRTSDKNEDLFRGCQVWIDHGHGIVTRYAHLSKVNPSLRLNQTVRRGDLLGYVGVSGTGENLPGRVKYPHLHFEIRVNDKYLGWGLTPQETLNLYQDIFDKSGD